MTQGDRELTDKDNMDVTNGMSSFGHDLVSRSVIIIIMSSQMHNV